MSSTEENGQAEAEPPGGKGPLAGRLDAARIDPKQWWTGFGAIQPKQAKYVWLALAAAFVGVLILGVVRNLDRDSLSSLSSRAGGIFSAKDPGVDSGAVFLDPEFFGKSGVPLWSGLGLAPRDPETPRDAGPPQSGRLNYLALERVFAEEINPALEAGSLPEWDSERAQNIQEIRMRALQEFAAGSYADAVDLLAMAEVSARAALEELDVRFRKHLDQALNFLEERRDPVLAGQYIDQALLLKPGDAEAQALRGRIEVLPEILQALEIANQAKAQNDRQAELEALERILLLDPLQAKVEKRYRRLTGEITDQAFQDAVLEGRSAVREGDLPAAKRALQQVQKLGPGRDDTALLEAEVELLGKRISVAQLEKKAEALVLEDNWPQVRDVLRKVLKIDPSNAIARVGVELAEKIIRADTQISAYLQRSDRLSSDNVADAARAVLADARDLQKRSGSKRLARQVEQLETALDKAGTKIDVRVRSDNMTEIVVREAGRVGLVTERVIRLRPGIYTFEGKRKGYRSKIVRLEIMAGSTGPVEVIVVCDEQI